MKAEAFHAVADILPEPLLLVDSSGRIDSYNPAAAELLGFNGDAAGSDLADHLYDPDRSRLSRYLSACARTRSLLPGAITLRDPAGSAKPCRCRGAVARPAAGVTPALLLLRLHPDEPATSRFVLLNRKIQELTQEIRIRRRVEGERSLLLAQERELRMQLELQATELEQQAEEAQQLTEELEITNEQLTHALAIAESANRTKGDFLAMMSHELRTPINATLGYVDLLLLGLRGALEEGQKRDLERIRRNQQHLLRVVTDILTFSRADAGKLEFDISDFAACEVLDAVTAMLEPLAHDRQIRLLLERCPADVLIRGDHAKVEQILVNLIANAFKFSSARGQVAVACEARSDMVEVRVQDWGPGIPAEKLEHIFEPFVQLEATLTRRIEGTGLGLTISREFARSMGGDLRAESSAGVGATFMLTLPRAAAPPGG